uniref:RNase H type-1 domain-containing protein n=1 Tax=Fagus sylvatica TaxID=28930 RepID=A0A2N9EZP7_FAGSY
MWRASNNALPVNTNLAHRHIQVDTTCAECQSYPETIIHVLWSCMFASQVWHNDQSFSALHAPMGGSFKDLIWCAMDAENKIDIELFAMIAWAIWKRRNIFRINQAADTPDRVFTQARDLLQEYSQALPPQVSKHHQPTDPCIWKPPPPGSFKANFDGAIFTNQLSAGIGVIIRNTNGDPIATLSKKIPLATSVEIVEARAAREALLLAYQLQLSNVIFEGDSSIIIAALSTSDECVTNYGTIIEECKAVAHSCSWRNFQHIRRQGNSAAHLLARKAKDLSEANVWLACMPPELIPVLSFDNVSVSS